MANVTHKILTQADPSLELTLSDASSPSWELEVYEGTFAGASVRVARKLALEDSLGNALPWVDMLTPALDAVLSIDEAGAGYLFSDLARLGYIKIYLVDAVPSTSITVGAAF